MAATNVVKNYDASGALTFHHLTRNAGRFANGGFVNTVSPTPDGTTTQADLMTLVIGRDTVGNPQSISDISTGTWQNAYKQVSQSYTYSDDYRLRTVNTTSAADGWVSPDFADPVGTFPVVNAPLTTTRLRNESFQYDWRGNMTSSVDDAHDFPDRSLGLTVQVTGSTGPDQFGQVNLANGTSATASYDAGGNLYSFNPTWNNASTREGYLYRWDELGQLAEAQRTDSDGLVHAQETYVYDRNGQRVITARRDPATGQTLYNVNVFDTLILEGAQYPSAQGGYQDDSTTANFYLSGGVLHVASRPGLPVSSTTNAGTTGVHWFLDLPDARGSTAFVVDYQTGEVVERSAHQAYGMIDTDFRPNLRWGAFREDVKFGGHWDNAEVGLTYFGARYYSPQLGRFVSPDPLAIHGLHGINPYEYASGSPLRYVDPDGLDGEDPSWDDLSIEQQAYEAAMAAAENVDNGCDRVRSKRRSRKRERRAVRDAGGAPVPVRDRAVGVFGSVRGVRCGRHRSGRGAVQRRPELGTGSARGSKYGGASVPGRECGESDRILQHIDACRTGDRNRGGLGCDGCGLHGDRLDGPARRAGAKGARGPATGLLPDDSGRPVRRSARERRRA